MINLPDRPAAPSRIGFVDDHPLTRFALRSLILRQAGWKVAFECHEPAEMLEALRHEVPDVLIVDLCFADASGLDLLAEIKTTYPDTRTLVYSANHERQYADRCFRLGACGYVSKEQPMHEVEQAIATVLRGYMYVSDRLTNGLMAELDASFEPPHA